MKLVCPVPPPATERVPEMLGVNVRAPAVGTMLIPYVTPLTDPDVVVPKVR